MREDVLNVIISICYKIYMRSNYVFGRRQTYNFALALPAAGMRQTRVCYQIITHLFIMKIRLDTEEYHGKLTPCFYGPICLTESIRL
jgi:hypothetical protein